MPTPRQQFNVNLDPALVARIKHNAIDRQLSVSELVGRVLHHHLEGEHRMSRKPESQSAVSLQPMVHVEDMAASIAFYEALGASVVHGSRDGDFALLSFGDTQIGLLAHPPNPDQNEGTVELNFQSAEPLADLEGRLRAAQITIAQPTTDEGFGRQLQIASPDGLLIKINQLEPDLYT